MPSFTASTQRQRFVEPDEPAMPPAGQGTSRRCASTNVASLALAILLLAFSQIGCSLAPKSLLWNNPEADYDEPPTVELGPEASVNARTEEESSYWDSLSFLDPAGLISKKPNKPPEAKKLYAQAEVLFKEGTATGDKTKLANAGKLYGQAAKLWVDSALEQDGLFMSGEAYFFADRIAYADSAYEALIAAYPNTRHMDVVAARRFAIAKYWVELDRASPESFWSVNMTDQRRPWRDTFGNAVRVFDRIRIDDVTGRLADDATMAAGNAHFERGDYQEADQFYTDLRTQFPASDHLFKAHFLNLKAKIESYRGAGYDFTVLNEADELLRDMMKRFPKQVQEEREYLEKAAAEIRYRKAEIEWNLGTYYENRFQYGGARTHYGTIVEEYAGTPFAERAQARLDVIKDYPDDPGKKYEWIKDYFEDDPLRVPPPKQPESATAEEVGAPSS